MADTSLDVPGTAASTAGADHTAMAGEPAGIGFDDAATASTATDDAAGIPADSEEGRPAGV
jgi:hypothetical protein